MGPCYILPDQMQYIPLEVSMAAALSAQNSQAGTSNSQVPPQTNATASAATTAPVYTTTSPIPTAMQGGSASGFPKGWDPSTGYGMHPDLFTTLVKGQFNALASQPMTSQPDPSATQPMGTQQDASAPPPMTLQQRLAILLQP